MRVARRLDWDKAARREKARAERDEELPVVGSDKPWVKPARREKARTEHDEELPVVSSGRPAEQPRKTKKSRRAIAGTGLESVYTTQWPRKRQKKKRRKKDSSRYKPVKHQQATRVVGGKTVRRWHVFRQHVDKKVVWAETRQEAQAIAKASGLRVKNIVPAPERDL